MNAGQAPRPVFAPGTAERSAVAAEHPGAATPGAEGFNAEDRTIYAGPPWTFATRSAKAKGKSAEVHDDCMSIDAIKALPLADLAAPDAELLLWAIDPHLPLVLDVRGRRRSPIEARAEREPT